MMSATLRATVLLFMWPLIALAQSAEVSIEREIDLASVLCRTHENEHERDQLLRSYPHLVNSQLWNALTNRGAAAYYEASPEQSLATYEIAIQVASRLRSPKMLAMTYYNIGRTYSGLNQLSKAIEAYEKSKLLFEQAGLKRDLTYILADLGLLYFIQEDYEKAARYSEQSIALADSAHAQVPAGIWPDQFGKATALATLADLSLRDGDYDKAIKRLRKSLGLYQELNHGGSDYDTYIAGGLQALGRVYTASGDYTQALTYLNQALVIVKKRADATARANLLNSIGVLYVEQEDYAQAKKTFDESLQIYLSIKDQREAARVLLNLGVTEQRQAHYDKALEHFRLSLERAKFNQSPDVSIAATEGIGVVLTAKKDFAGSLETFNAALEIAREQKNRTRETELLWRSAELYYEMGNFTEAARFAAIATVMARTGHLPKLDYLATTTLGQIYAAQGELDIAKQTLAQAVEQLEALRDQVAGQETSAQLFFENKLISYHALVDILAKQDKPLEALLYAERAKGRVLLDVMRSARPDMLKLLTPAEKEERQRLNLKIIEINDRIKRDETTNSASLNSLYAELDAARLEYQAFQDAVYVRSPSLRIRNGRIATLTAAEVDDLVEKDTAYLEYVVAKDRVSLFVLTRDKSTGASKIKLYPIAMRPDELIRKVNQFHDRLANRHPAYATPARELYAMLIGPAKQQLRGSETICIVPDSFLWNVPFQALMTADSRFLIEDHALFYAPSLSVLREMNRKKAAIANRDSSLIAFGNPVIGKDEQRNEELCPLPEAEAEVNSIAKSFGPQNRNVLIGRKATEKTFRSLAPAYANIHLATHGVLDNRHPLYSHLMLTKTESDLENDGLLEAREIMNMTLPADLAVLSACETANGKIAPGEGVIGMSWAFLVAGTRSMLVSQWKVNSESTKHLMVNFYKAFESDNTLPRSKKASALRKSTLRTMKDQRYRHPFYWAGFVLVGSNY